MTSVTQLRTVTLSSAALLTADQKINAGDDLRFAGRGLLCRPLHRRRLLQQVTAALVANDGHLDHIGGCFAHRGAILTGNVGKLAEAVFSVEVICPRLMNQRDAENTN